MSLSPPIEQHDHFLVAFSNLVSYTIEPELLEPRRPLELILKTLAPLKNLIHFHWHLNTLVLDDFQRNPPETIIALPSIKVLTLEVATSHHNELQFPHWVDIFPNVQIIILYHYMYGRGCLVCEEEEDELDLEPDWALNSDDDTEYDDDAEDDDHFDAIAAPAIPNIALPCVRSLLQPLKQCPQLKKIYYTAGREWKLLTREFRVEDL